MAASTHVRVFLVTDCETFRPPYIMGGTERQLSDLARELDRLGIETTVIARECLDELPTAEIVQSENAPRTLFVAPPPVGKGVGWAALGPNLRHIAGTLRLLLRARREYDVITVSGFRQLALPVTFAAWLARKPCVIRIESAWDLDDELSPESNARIGRAAKLITSTIIRLSRLIAFRLAQRIVAFSDPLEAQLVQLGAPRRKIELVPNGVDVERFAPVCAAAKTALRARLRLPADRTIFIYTGRICRSKGLRELLATWERMAQRPDAMLLIVGSAYSLHESCAQEVREAAARYPGAIEWRGPVDNVAEYLQASDVFVFLSYFEAFGLSILEAVATGLPCLLTDVGCARQVVSHHRDGAIVPARADPQTILRELEWLESCRGQWAEMGARARARVVSAYALETVARRYGALFDVLCARRRCPDARAADNGRPANRPHIGSSVHVHRTPAIGPLVRDPRRPPDGRPASGSR